MHILLYPYLGGPLAGGPGEISPSAPPLRGPVYWSVLVKPYTIIQQKSELGASPLEY
jgi:hypothetical protein